MSCELADSATARPSNRTEASFRAAPVMVMSQDSVDDVLILNASDDFDGPTAATANFNIDTAALGVLLQQALAFQAATYTLTDQLNQILQLTLGWRFNALKAGWSTAAIGVCAIQKQNMKMYEVN